MVRTAFISLLLVVSCVSFAQPETTPISDLLGVYSNERDRFIIFEDIEAKKPFASIRVRGGNNHLCAFQGPVKLADKNLMTIDDGSYSRKNNNDICRLTVEIKQETLKIIDASPHESCRTYCGARAHLNGLTFHRTCNEEPRVKLEYGDWLFTCGGASFLHKRF